MKKILMMFVVLLLSMIFTACTPKDQTLYKAGNTAFKASLYDDAIEKYLEAITLNPDHVKANFNLAVSYTKLDPPNHENAAIYMRKTIEKAEETGVDPAKIKKYKKKAKRIIKAYYENIVKIEDTLESYQKFVEEYPDYSGTKDIEAKIVEKKFEEYKKNDTIEGYEEYIKNNPDSKYVYDAESGIYNKLIGKDDNAAFKAFMEAHPESKFNAEIKTKLAGKAYDVILKLKSDDEKITKLKEFIESYPDTDLAGSAKTKIDDIAWEAAKKNGSEKAYNKYIKDNPDGAHKDDALLKMDQAKFSKVKSEANALSSLEEKIEIYKKFLKDNAENRYAKKVKEQIIGLEKAIKKKKEDAEAKKKAEKEAMLQAQEDALAEKAAAEAAEEGGEEDGGEEEEDAEEGGDAEEAGEEEQPGDLFIP